MGFEMLIFGLILFCFGRDCDPEQILPARLLLVNATDQGPNCDDSHCQTCGGDWIERHYPLIVFRQDDGVEIEGVDDLSCDEFIERERELPDDLKCWRPDNRKLCVRLRAQGPLQIPGGECLDVEKPDNDCNRTNLHWLGSVSFFDNRYTYFKRNIEPANRSPTVTWIDLPAAGRMEVASVGGQGNNHTIWRRKGDPEGFPGRSLGERVVWKIEKLEGDRSVVIETCDDDSTARLTLPQGKRIAVLNLPKPIFDDLTRDPTESEDDLYHFRLYYNLLEKDDLGGICDVPTYRSNSGVKSHLKPFPLGHWVSRGEAGFDGVKIRTDSGSALCPPSKFP